MQTPERQALTTPADKLRWVRKFIEYARYELQPGEQQIGDQFPRQDAADKAIRLIDELLTPPASPATEPGQSAEDVINEAMRLVEVLPADDRLSDAVDRLKMARLSVEDYRAGRARRVPVDLADAWWAGRKSACDLPVETATGPEIQARCRRDLAALASPATETGACEAVSPNGWSCDRQKGHSGEHVAMSQMDNCIVEQWVTPPQEG